MGLSRTVSEIYGDFNRKSQNFPTPFYFASPLKGFASPWNWVPALEIEKTRMMGLSGREKSLTISSAIWIQYTNVTDRRTDGLTDTGRQQRPRLRIASRGKKYKSVFCQWKHYRLHICSLSLSLTHTHTHIQWNLVSSLFFRLINSFPIDQLVSQNTIIIFGMSKAIAGATVAFRNSDPDRLSITLCQSLSFTALLKRPGHKIYRIIWGWGINDVQNRTFGFPRRLPTLSIISGRDSEYCCSWGAAAMDTVTLRRSSVTRRASD